MLSSTEKAPRGPAMLFTDPTPEQAADIVAISRLAVSYSEAICRGEIDEAVLAYADDGVLASAITEDAVGHDATAAMFAEQGFDGATTREIARRAGVAEPLVFRHFGSKAGLLEGVVVAPLTDFVEEFATRWQDDMRAHRNLEARVNDFVGRLYDLL